MTDHLLSIRQREPRKEGEADADAGFLGLSSQPLVSRRSFLRRGGHSQPLEDEVVVTNTLPVPEGASRAGNLKVLSIASIVAKSVQAIFTDDSVSKIFLGENF